MQDVNLYGNATLMHGDMREVERLKQEMSNPKRCYNEPMTNTKAMHRSHDLLGKAEVSLFASACNHSYHYQSDIQKLGLRERNAYQQ